MQILPVSEDTIALALRVLEEGGIVAHATETCYGFACDLTNQEAVGGLFAVKCRPLDMPVSGLFASVEDAKRYVKWTAHAQELAEKHLPGPLTLILERLPEPVFMPFVTPVGGRKIGIRISSHPVAQALAAGFRLPLSTTSANVHGQPNTYSAEEIQTQFAESPYKPDLILDSGRLPPTPPSTVLDLTQEEIVLRREGSIETGSM